MKSSALETLETRDPSNLLVAVAVVSAPVIKTIAHNKPQFQKQCT